MKLDKSRTARAVAFAVVVMAGVAVLVALAGVKAPPAQSGQVRADLSAAAPPAAPWQAGAAHAVNRGRQASTAEPAAICRMLPECSSDSDCDLRCGPGLGKCLHNKCPRRICACR